MLNEKIVQPTLKGLTKTVIVSKIRIYCRVNSIFVSIVQLGEI